MKKRLLALFCALAVGGAVTAKTVGATSPGGNLRMEIEVADKISYTVWSGADKVLDACTLSLTLADRTLGEAPRLRSVKRSSADEMLERRNPTKDAVVRNCYNAVQLRFAGDYERVKSVGSFTLNDSCMKPVPAPLMYAAVRAYIKNIILKPVSH